MRIIEKTEAWIENDGATLIVVLTYSDGSYLERSFDMDDVHESHYGWYYVGAGC